ncbi:MAG: creatininase family protein [Bacteroidales bacterium]
MVRTHNYNVAILPLGTTEAHNLHLPYGTDIFLALDVAIKSAKTAGENRGNNFQSIIDFSKIKEEKELYLQHE